LLTAARFDPQYNSFSSQSGSVIEERVKPYSARYEVRQDAEYRTRFVPIFVWQGAEANPIHGESDAVKKFVSILYSNCPVPIEFIEYDQVDANAAFKRI